ncbi:MAG: CPBP family intramembrane metalloprotease, partial [Armatimonadota bacterium]|nr:CPBP family intramembrane metalloprotease [Armatimonadota bacterium]
WGVLTYLAAVPLLVITAALLSRLAPFLPTPPNPAAEIALGLRSRWEWVLLAAMAVGVAPVVEEAYFRGVLYGAFRQQLGVRWGVLLSAGAFAAVHPQLPLGFFPILALGVLLTVALEWRRSLTPCIVAHMLNNATALYLTSLLGSAW